MIESRRDQLDNESNDSGHRRVTDQNLTQLRSALDFLRQAATSEGFVLCGVTPAVTSTGYNDLLRWIESGFAGEMDYFANRSGAYQNPSSILVGARSIVVLAHPYDCGRFQTAKIGRGKIARYAWCGDDYHDTIHPKLKRLGRLLQSEYPQANVRGVVDTAPLMEREVAELAGLGWRGKNTLLLSKTLGSYFFLACLLTDVELPPDDPHDGFHCGTCTACLQACPTNAFPQAGVLDATKCIAYLTIEHRGHIDRPLRSAIGDWLFGCDICQEVCPWNRKPQRKSDHPPRRLETLDLAELFSIDDNEFRKRFRKTPLWRTRRRGILRNAAIVLGNQRDPAAVNTLIIGLNDNEPIVRAASAWALSRIKTNEAIEGLKNRIRIEKDTEVSNEIQLALAGEVK